MRSFISEGTKVLVNAVFQVQEVLPLNVIEVIPGAVISLQTQFTGVTSKGASKLKVYTLKALLIEGAVIPKVANHLMSLCMACTPQEGAILPNRNFNSSGNIQIAVVVPKPIIRYIFRQLYRQYFMRSDRGCTISQ